MTSGSVSLESPEPDYLKPSYLAQVKLVISRDKPFSQEFFLKAFNPKAESAKFVKTMKVLAVVCGEETLTLVSAKDTMFNIYQKEKSSIPLEYSLEKVWKNVHPNAYIDGINGCPIEGFKLCS